MKDNIGFLFLIIILFFFLPFSYFLFLVYLLATKNQQRRRMERVVGGSEIDQEKQRNYKTIPAARKSQCDNNYIFIAALSLAAEGFGMGLWGPWAHRLVYWWLLVGWDYGTLSRGKPLSPPTTSNLAVISSWAARSPRPVLSSLSISFPFHPTAQ